MKASPLRRHRPDREPARPRTSALALLASVFGATAVAGPAAAQDANFERDPEAPVGESGIRVPHGFQVQVFAEGVGRARHIAVRENGDAYVALREPHQEGGIAALRDADGDGRADEVSYFGEHGGGTGLQIRDGWLYASSDSGLFRYSLPDEGLVPQGEPEVVVEGFPKQESHSAKAFAIDEDGNLYVNVAAPSNACQEQDRTQGSPGQEPCPLLEEHAGIWRFDAEKTGQTFSADKRFVTGVRNVVALDVNPANGELYFVQHGRDQLHELFPDLYSVEQNARLPAEEFHIAREGANYGWPYTYWDHERGERVVAPEYGGDGTETAEQGQYQQPIMTFPAHWAPNDLLFYEEGPFPDDFRGGAFVAFHGSWNRAPLPQRGYNVTFVPFDGAEPAGDWHVFADGFEGAEEIADSDDAERRPMGLAQGPDGALYITDSVKGRVWRVTWRG